MTEMAGGQSLGNAQGRISIDTSDLLRIQALTRQVGQVVSQNLGQIDGGAKRAQASLGGLSNSFNGLLGAFGVATGGAAIAAQFTRFALAADQTATAYRRQGVAAVSLAGSQRELNELLRTYNQVTGNTIDKATALADVTRLQAVGFADNAAELEKFTIASRGISIAMGSSQDYIIGQLQLAIANQSTMRLDQLGLGVSEVEGRIKALKEADSSLTKEMAYQNAILGLAIEKYGALAKSQEAQATGAEKASKAWKDLQLQFGELAKSPINQAMSLLAHQLDLIAVGARSAARDMNYLQSLAAKEAPKNSWLTMLLLGGAQATGLMPLLTTRAPTSSLEENVLRGKIRGQENILAKANEGLTLARSTGNSAEVERMTGIVRQVNTELAQLKAQLMRASLVAERFGKAGTSGLDLGLLPQAPRGAATTGPTFTTEQTDAIGQWARDVADLERQSGQARVEATRQYESQRADAIRDYGQQIAREEQDFARNRARAIRDHNQQMADLQADAAKREADATKDYARAVAEVGANAAKRESKWQSDANERIAELRADGNERLHELEEAYNRSRERAERDHRDRLLGAAAQLDAVAVFEEQRNYKRQQQDAQDNYEEQRTKAQEALSKQIADAQEAQAERLADAREADAERLADLRAAFEEQRQAASEADAERLAEMQAAFAQRLADEDAERAIQQQRRAEDHAEQLRQLDQAQAERMAKINDQAAREKRALDDQFLEELSALGIHNEQWLKIQAERQKQSLELFNEWFDQIDKRFAVQGPKTQAETPSAWPQSFADGGWVQRSGYAQVHAGEFVVPASQARAMAGGMARNITIGDIVVHGAPGMDTNALALAVRREIVAALEEVA